MDKISEAKNGAALDSLTAWWKRLLEKAGLRERREVVPAEYHSIEARTRAFNRGMRAVRRHQRLKQKYPLPRHIQDKLSMR
jgi:hypothetical protein